MSTFISSSTYPSYIKPSQDKNIITHGCCGLSNHSSFHSFSGIKVDSLHQRVFKFGVFREETSSFELGYVKDKILFGGLERNSKIGSFHQKKFKLRTIREKVSNFGFGEDKDGVLFNGMLNNKNKRVVLVRLNKGFGFNGGGGGGGGGDNNGRVLGNLALAVGLTYLSFTGQLGWLLDAIVSVWLFVVLLPVVGLGVLFWWAGRDIVQSSCPSCGNEFQIFRSAIGEDSQQCPYCSQPFSVEGDEFVSDPINFSREDNTFGQAFNDFFPRSKKGKAVSKTIVDVEAEVTDVD